MTELEMVKELKEDSYVRDYYSNYLDDIEFALTKKSKKEQAIDVIMKKSIDLNWLKYCIKENKDYDYYIKHLDDDEDTLTKEEFNLLKEVVEC